jgi:hypothetical protein
MCVEGNFDAEGYEIKGVAVTGGFVKNDASGIFSFDNTIDLNDLDDVNAASPSLGDHLEFDGSNWVPAAPGHTTPGASALDDLSDVTVSSPADGQYLKFSGGSWSNQGLFLNQLSDVSVGGVATGDVLQWSGTVFFSDPITDAMVPDILTFTQVQIASGSTNGIYDGASGREYIIFLASSLAVNHFQVRNSPAGSGPLLLTAGDDANVDLNLSPKGTGQVISSNGFETSSVDAYHLGDKDTDGTWRFVRSGTDLEVERREAGSYVSKGSFTA